MSARFRFKPKIKLGERKTRLQKDTRIDEIAPLVGATSEHINRNVENDIGTFAHSEKEGDNVLVASSKESFLNNSTIPIACGNNLEVSISQNIIREQQQNITTSLKPSDALCVEDSSKLKRNNKDDKKSNGKNVKKTREKKTRRKRTKLVDVDMSKSRLPVRDYIYKNPRQNPTPSESIRREMKECEKKLKKMKKRQNKSESDLEEISKVEEQLESIKDRFDPTRLLQRQVKEDTVEGSFSKRSTLYTQAAGAVAQEATLYHTELSIGPDGSLIETTKEDEKTTSVKRSNATRSAVTKNPCKVSYSNYSN